MNKVLVKYYNIQGALRTLDILEQNKIYMHIHTILVHAATQKNESYKTFIECKRYSTKSELGKTASCHPYLNQPDRRLGLPSHRQCVRLKLGTNRSLCRSGCENTPSERQRCFCQTSEHEIDRCHPATRRLTFSLDMDRSPVLTKQS